MENHNIHHYKECGLDNIYLTNGVNILETPYGRTTSINDLDGLHRAIGLHVANTKSRLSGKEVKFLRHELDLSQAVLATLLRTTEQTFARWEKGKIKLPGPAQALLTAFYMENVKGGSTLAKHLEHLAQLDAEVHEDLCLSYSDSEWEQCAA
ncbi:MAG: hypothetical protein V3V13_02075 [Paracoccaceae bacterium]